MPAMLSDSALAQLQLAAYAYTAPFAWDWQSTLQSAAAPIAAGLKRQDGAQIIIMPGTGGGLDAAETRRQWALNLSPLPDKMPHGVFGWVCRRFYDEIEDFFAQLWPRLGAGDIYVIGHSRGAPQAAYVAGLLRAHGAEVKRLVQFAPPRPGGSAFAGYMAPVDKALYRNSGPDGHDYVTDVPPDIPFIEECCQLAALTDVHAEPLSADAWGPFRFHHMELYAKALATGGERAAL